VGIELESVLRGTEITDSNLGHLRPFTLGGGLSFKIGFIAAVLVYFCFTGIDT
jgi:hypothetical protein